MEFINDIKDDFINTSQKGDENNENEVAEYKVNPVMQKIEDDYIQTFLSLAEKQKTEVLEVTLVKEKATNQADNEDLASILKHDTPLQKQETKHSGHLSKPKNVISQESKKNL